MYPSEINVFGGTFDNAEAAFQSQKKPSMSKEFEGISGSSARKKGRSVKLDSNEIADWDRRKVSVMEEIVRSKFDQNKDLAQRLIETDDEDLVEINSWGDTFWGVDSRTGNGSNELGKILKRVKNDLIKE